MEVIQEFKNQYSIYFNTRRQIQSEPVDDITRETNTLQISIQKCSVRSCISVEHRFNRFNSLESQCRFVDKIRLGIVINLSK